MTTRLNAKTVQLTHELADELELAAECIKADHWGLAAIYFGNARDLAYEIEAEESKDLPTEGIHP